MKKQSNQRPPAGASKGPPPPPPPRKVVGTPTRIIADIDYAALEQRVMAYYSKDPVSLKAMYEGRRHMIGPCLCGDPYCPRCGNPEEAAFSDAVDEMFEVILSDHDYDLLELKLFEQAGHAAVKAHRDVYGHINAVNDPEPVEDIDG